ncbi:acyltransferase domain-containing protein [Enterobacillus tribolii]|nr:acyltransferase domain-containing protein [Enterobacillus tribolii]
MLMDNQPVKTIFMYTGQGSQYYHMGAGLYATNPVFRQRMDKLNHMATDLFGFSPLAGLYAPERLKSTPFEDTVLSSLTIFMLERAITDTLIHYDCRPDGVLSLSMGAFAALCASGVSDDETMLVALHRQAQAMERCCAGGIMVAVLAPVTLWQEEDTLRLNSEIAAINGESHFVLSLPRSALAQVEARLTIRKAPFQRMPVSRAYHSRWIEPACQEVLNAFGDVAFRRAKMPVSLCLAAPVSGDISPQIMWNIARGPICLRDAVQRLEREGGYRYLDAGPSGTAATLLKYMLPAARQSAVRSLLSPLKQDERVLDELLITAA